MATTARRIQTSVSKSGKPVEIVRPTINYLVVTIKGTAPLLQNPKTKAYLDQITGSGEGKAAPAKTLKDPETEYFARLKQTKDGIGLVPVEAFTGRKGAFPTAARLAKLKKISSTAVLAGVKVKPDVMLEFADGIRGYLLLQNASRPVNDRHIAEINKMGQSIPVPIYRPRYDEWELTLHISYWPNLVSLSNLMSLLATMGEAGIGSWRPENGGTFGTFKLTSAMELSGGFD